MDFFNTLLVLTSAGGIGQTENKSGAFTFEFIQLGHGGWPDYRMHGPAVGLIGDF